MSQLKQEYRGLMERLDHHAVAMRRPEDERALQGWRELLEVMYSPEEAELASRMPMMPTRLSRLARRFDMPEEELRAKLEPLCDKGLVMDLVSRSSGEAKYLLAPPVVGFFEFSMMRAHDMFDKLSVAKAMDAYMHGDDTFAREVFGNDTVVGRAMVHEDVMAADIPEVLDWERTTSLLREAEQIAVSHCYCRHKAEHLGEACDVPQEICLSLNGGAEFIIRRGFGREIDEEQALSIVTDARKLGLVQIADNVQNEPASALRDQRLRPEGGQPQRFRAALQPRRLQGLLALLPGLPDRGHRHDARTHRRKAQERASAGLRFRALHRLWRMRHDLPPRGDPHGAPDRAQPCAREHHRTRRAPDARARPPRRSALRRERKPWGGVPQPRGEGAHEAAPGRTGPSVRASEIAVRQLRAEERPRHRCLGAHARQLRVSSQVSHPMSSEASHEIRRTATR
jgi:hypothetical protein